MRILAAHVLRARRNRLTNRVEAVVRLIVQPDGPAHTREVRVQVAAPARAPGAASLRQRLCAAAKLTCAARPGLFRQAA